MTPEVKRRIEQIRRGIVPEGYKKTKAGIIPMDWDVKEVGAHIREYKQLSNNINDIQIYTSSRKGLLPQLEYYSDKQIVETNLGYKVVPNEYATYRHMSDDDVFHFNVNTTGREILVSSEYPVFCASPDAELGFLIPALNGTARFRYFCRTQKLGGTRTRLYLENLKKYLIPTPPLEEQKKIARILSLQDKVIELKEKHLAEKQRQKKFLMQQLLTGKKRLMGFSDPWKMVKACRVFKNIVDKKHNGDLEVLSATQDRGIIPRSQVDIDIKYEESSLVGYKKVIKGNFVISLRSFQGGIEYSEYTGIVSPAYTVLSSCMTIVDEFYKQYFKSNNFIERLGVAVYGIRDGKQISYEDFGMLKIPYPSPEEQQPIARILSTADQEIHLLQQDLEQEKKKKKALMQLLLTGIVRVHA